MARVRSKARFAGVFVLLALAGAVHGCADDDGSSLMSGSVSGRVRDGQSGKTLGGAQVDFLADTGESASDKSDKDGHYGITVQALSPLGRLTVSKAGYHTRVVTTFLDDGDVSVDIDLLRE